MSSMENSSTAVKTLEATKDVLPSDLRKVLKSVARNGRCGWLSWQQADNEGKPTKHRNGKRKRSDLPGDSDCSRFEREDTASHYECDSEGTSTTNNSDVSYRRRNEHGQQQPLQAATARRVKYTSLGQAFAVAIGLALDHAYQSQGGYKLSPAEIRKFTTQTKNANPEAIFQERRQRLMSLCHGKGHREGAPFTLQRMAEVLLTPTRYYTQTHKLCNCLEKLLMVTSSIQAFGGSGGGQTLQTRREEREMAALAYERGRQESEHRNRRFRRRLSPSIAADFSQEGHHPDKNVAASNNHSEERNGKSPEKSSAESNYPFATGNTRESLEAIAKSSLRNTFEHGSDIDVVHRVRSTRSLTASPPLGTTSGDAAIASHSTVASFFRHLNEPQGTLADSPDLRPLVSEVGSRLSATSVFSNLDTLSTLDGAASAALDSSLNTPRLLQGRYVATSAGVALGTSPLDIVIDHQQGEAQLNNSANKYAEAEIEVDRSSASNSDVDSESDDFSLDDSASDRSDGSDSGTAYEPFSAARVIALNRMQQQQRLQQIRVQSLGELRPHVDMEYQSGDSIDSTMAEDSGGSDSSSSDLAD